MQRLEVHPIAVQGEGCPRALLERLGEILDERAAVRMVARGVLADETNQGRVPGLEHTMRVEELGQNRQRQARRRIGQDWLQRRTGPADQVQETPARCANLFLIAVTLLGQPLQRVLVWARHVYRVEHAPTEVR